MNLFRQTNSSIASPASFRALYELNRLPVFRYVYALTGGSQEDAEDLTAETFLRAWKARHQFQGEMDSAIGWLIGIAKRLVIDDYRRTVRATRNLPTDLNSKSTPEQTAIQEEQQKLLLRLVADLPDEQREIIILRYLLGWRVNDIARHMGASENKISVSLHRTLSKLREQWTELDLENLSAMFMQKETTYEPHPDEKQMEELLEHAAPRTTGRLEKRLASAPWTTQAIQSSPSISVSYPRCPHGFPDLCRHPAGTLPLRRTSCNSSPAPRVIRITHRSRT